MPFPLAHPAAVLPLRRFCPKYLSFPALVMGSLSPDAGYLLGQSQLEEISHSLGGGLCFGSIVGLAIVFGFNRMAPPLIRFSPRSCRDTLAALCRQTSTPIYVLVASVLIGTATHLLLEAFTHARGWFVLHSTLLQAIVFRINWHQIRVCHLLWYLASFVGIAWLAMAFQKWRQATIPGTASISLPSRILAGVLAAALVVPIEVVHHLVRSRLGLVLVSLLSAVIAATAILWIASIGMQKGPNQQNH